MTQASTQERLGITPLVPAVDPPRALPRERLLDLDVTKIQVPKVGKTDPGVNIPLIVLDPDGHEVVWVSRALSAVSNEGLADKTVLAYAKAFLRAARVMWAIEADPATLSRVEYLVVRGWLNAGLRRTKRVSDDAARPLSQATVDLTESALATIYESGVANGLISHNPITEVNGVRAAEPGTVLYDSGFAGHASRAGAGRKRRGHKRPAKEIKILGPEMREHLRNATRLRDRALWTLCLDTGPRISEALSITPSTYLPHANLALVVAKGRGGATREIPVSDRTTAVIDEYLAELAAKGWRPAAHDQIFRSIKAPYEPLTYDAAWKALRRATRTPDIHPHALRHTAATELLDLLQGTAGRRLITVQHVLGHQNIATTRKYLHTETAEVIEAVVKARKSPLRRTQSVLHEVYTPEHIALMELLRKEAQ